MADTPTLRGIDHLALRSFDAERTLTFYRDVLGFAFLGASIGQEDETRRFLLLAFGLPGGGAIDFLEVEGDEKAPADTNRHVAFAVEARQDLDAWEAHLKAHDVWVSDLVEHDDHVSRYVFDPNDNFVEITLRTAKPPADPDGGAAVVAEWAQSTNKAPAS